MAHHRHRRETPSVLTRLGVGRLRPGAAVFAAPLAVLATTGAVSLGVMSADLGAAPAPFEGPVVGGDTVQAADAAGEVRRSISRGGITRTGGAAGGGADSKAGAGAPPASPQSLVDDDVPVELQQMIDPAATRLAVAAADAELWTTAPLNLWTQPGDEAELTGEIPAGEEVVVTGRSLYGRDEVVVEGVSRWVTEGYLSEDEPLTVGGSCTNGTTVPSGVSPNIVKVHEAVCANFPEITTYGTFRSDGEHAQGLAVDIMVSGDRGYQVAEFVRAHYAELGVDYIIYSQRIWSVDRSSEGWRGMEDRGSTTANHYDHVHVTTY